MQSDVAAIAGTMQGRIAIGALPLGRTHVLPAAIAAALQRHPNIRVTTVESPYEALVAGLRDGDIVRLCAELGELSTLVDEAEWAARPPALGPVDAPGTGRELFAFMRQGASPAEEGGSAMLARMEALL